MPFLGLRKADRYSRRHQFHGKEKNIYNSCPTSSYPPTQNHSNEARTDEGDEGDSSPAPIQTQLSSYVGWKMQFVELKEPSVDILQ